MNSPFLANRNALLTKEEMLDILKKATEYVEESKNEHFYFDYFNLTDGLYLFGYVE